MSRVLDRLVKKDHRIMSCDYFGSYNTGGDGGYGCHCGCWESNNDCPTAGKVEEE